MFSIETEAIPIETLCLDFLYILPRLCHFTKYFLYFHIYAAYQMVAVAADLFDNYFYYWWAIPASFLIFQSFKTNNFVTTLNIQRG